MGDSHYNDPDDRLGAKSLGQSSIMHTKPIRDITENQRTARFDRVGIDGPRFFRSLAMTASDSGGQPLQIRLDTVLGSLRLPGGQ